MESINFRNKYLPNRIRGWTVTAPFKIAFSIVVCLFSALVCAAGDHDTSPLSRERFQLMPYPAAMEVREGTHKLSKRQYVYFENIAEDRQQLMLDWLKISLPSAIITTTAQQERASIQISAKKPDVQRYPGLKTNESYELSVGEESIVISAASPVGSLLGVHTLRQLLHQFPNKLPSLHIEDSPRFPWRGLLIDSVRHFIPLAELKRQIEGMASAKLNVFHWHLTDDQGWRIESKTYPLLHRQASDGLYYSQQEIRELVEFARLRGIRVVPEFDVPGHATAIAVAYPQLITQPGPYALERHWGVFQPLLNPSSPQVYSFIETMVEELTGLFPDRYIHIGGDEVNPQQWQESPAVVSYMQENNLNDMEALHAHFNQKVQLILTKHNRKMMGWDEIFHPKLSSDVVIQSWRGMESLQQVTQQGFKGLLSTGYYIDQPQRTRFHYSNHPQGGVGDHPLKKVLKQTDIQQAAEFTISRLKGSAVTGKLWLTGSEAIVQLNDQPPLLANFAQLSDLAIVKLASWMGPVRLLLSPSNPSFSARLFIGNTPYPIEGKWLKDEPVMPQLPPDKQSAPSQDNILGGEAALWSEIVTQRNIDLRIWPRLYAIGERLWSPASLDDEQDMYQRLLAVDHYAVTKVGLKHHEQALRAVKEELDLQDDQRARSVLKLADFIEQAQYYTRHHLKFQADQYHQQAPLDQLVDFLPAESVQVALTEMAIERLVGKNREALHSIRNQFKEWQSAIPAVKQSAEGTAWEAQIHDLMVDSEQAISVALAIVNQCHQLDDEQLVQRYRETLQQVGRIRKDEIIVAPAYLGELLLAYCG